MPGASPPLPTEPILSFSNTFHRRAPTSEVNVPLKGLRPPMGNPGSTTVNVCALKHFALMCSEV